MISTQKNPDDVVITLAVRTPLCKAFKGGLKDTDLDYLVYSLLKEVLNKSKIDPALIEDVCMGNVRSYSCGTWSSLTNDQRLEKAEQPAFCEPPLSPPESRTQQAAPR